MPILAFISWMMISTMNEGMRVHKSLIAVNGPGDRVGCDPPGIIIHAPGDDPRAEDGQEKTDIPQD